MVHSMNASESVTLHLRGAREHNLAGVDLDLPLGAWIAVTGPSGSGKTSLVRDTIVREGERRYLGSLSARARHFLGKLGHATLDDLDGLPVALAVGEPRISANARSTVGTQTGILDLLRLLFARQAQGPAGEPLTRSHFSFNHPLGSCEACRGLGLQDCVDPSLLVADPAKSIRSGALVPTLKSGYTVYSQVTLEVMDTICRAHGFDVDTPWCELTEEQQSVVLFGTRALKVPFGKHAIESRMKWEGITARPREEGYYRGLVPVIQETLQRNRNPNILRFVRSVACGECGGTRLSRVGRQARLGDLTLPEVLAPPVCTLGRLGRDPSSEEMLEASDHAPALLQRLPRSPVLAALAPAIDARLARLQRLGLGHLSLHRTAASLSDGEAQRLRLVAQLTAGLGGMLVALDEPTLGLHPAEQAGMVSVLEELRRLGNTLLVVEHDPDMVRHAGHLVELGPGAGPEGGRVVFAGKPPNTPLGEAPAHKAEPRAGDGELVMWGATLHNLDAAELRIALGAFNVVCGPSGAGKSSLVFGTLLPALAGGPGGAFEKLELLVSGQRRDRKNATLGASGGPRVRAVDARPIGRNPRSTPATWSGLFDLVRKRFAATDTARALGFGPGRFSFNNPEGRCDECEGLGVQRIGLHLLPDVELLCAACGGGRYEPATLTVRLSIAEGTTSPTPPDANIAEVLAMDVRTAARFFAQDAPLARPLAAMERLGLGYLRLGQSSKQLSRGESQRVKLATLLGDASAQPSFLLLDEPDRGLHPVDITRLVDTIDALVEAGHTVVAISHHKHIWAAADRLTEVHNGTARLIGEGERVDFAGEFNDFELDPSPAPPPQAIELRGVRTHNLRSLDVTLPHRALTVVGGPSGSGKSSLVFDTLAAEAWARFSEGLPFAVRRFIRHLPRPDLDEARGLTPVLALRQGAAHTDRRSTVATQSEIGPLLRLLFSRAGSLHGKPALETHGFTAEHFSVDRALGACRDCSGAAVVQRCDPARLVDDPSKPLAGGACHGTRPGRFFTEPGGQHMATLATAMVAASKASPALSGLDLPRASRLLSERPWAKVPAALRDLALQGYGAEEFEVAWSVGHAEGGGEHRFTGTWDGLLARVEQEARRRANAKAAAKWAEPLIEVACEACGGSGLRPELAATTLGNLTLPELWALPLDQVAPRLRALGRENGGLDSRRRAVVAAVLAELEQRLAELVELGLGHLALGRTSRSLSDGELQRVRLAGVLRSGLTGVTLALDEPAAGLHARDVTRLAALLRRAVDAGNTPVVVSHRQGLWRAADHHLTLGPGAGAAGGRWVVEAKQRGEKAGRTRVRPQPARTIDSGRLQIRGASANNLAEIDVELPACGLVALTGVSGSGKSSLLFDVLGTSLRKDATGALPVACKQIELPPGHPGFASVQGERRRGGSAGTVSGALGLLAPMQRAFGEAARTAGLDLPRAAFSFQSPKGRCEVCKGSGFESVAMDFLADLNLPCPGCDGRRYRPEVLAATWLGLDVVTFLATSAVELVVRIDSESMDRVPAHVRKLSAGLQALAEVGLGHLSLGRRRRDLSGGEIQRLQLAASLNDASSPSLHLFDEPARGLHDTDIEHLVGTFRRLAEGGDLVVVAEHRLALIAATDHVIDLGPEGGPRGGQLVDAGPPEALTRGHTAAALAERRG